MKQTISFGKIAIFFVIFVLVNACQSNIIQEEETSNNELNDEFSLKSAFSGKTSYIVQLDDANLISEIKGIKGYINRKNKVKGMALGLLKKNGINDGQIGFVYSNSIIGFSVKIAPGQAKKLMDDYEVKSVREDKIITLAPPSKPIKETDETLTQETPWGITRVGGAGNGTGKTAWIIDSGIDLDHPDLNVDASRGFSAFTKGKDAGFDDGNGHGSHVAGTIAALNNSFGVVGVAAGAYVVPVKVLDSKGSGGYSGVIAGIDHVAANGAAGDVANMSLGGPVSIDLDEAVANAAASTGIIFVLAAGNESDDVLNHSPGRVNGPNVITVSAMDSNDVFAYFSNYGSSVDFCAPGVSIKSCYKGGDYTTLNGTSMASPHVAGIALLGVVQTDGYVNNDPAAPADPIAHR